ncbi:MAG: cell division protein FtsZ [Pseudomonadota bacterium]
MALNLTDVDDHDLRARITVFGVGGAGGNAVNNMIEKNLEGVEFIAANTDSQALSASRADRRIQLGQGVTRGLGAGSKPEVGQSSAEESVDEIAAALDGAHMCFITGGMGGGTGTGAAPVVARVAREMGILTVGVVTKPFQFEGARRMMLAEAGVSEMQQFVDTLIVIPNQNLFQVASERTTFVEAFQLADDVLYQGVQGVTDLMVRPGMINLDFADVRSVMEEMGKAMMGTGEADGETRAIDAAEKAIANPLLDEVSLKGAKGVLINITGGYDLTLFEMDEAANRIKDEVDPNALIKFGSAIDPDMEGKMRVSVVATGIDAETMERRPPEEFAPQRRRPAVTDPTGVQAIRGAMQRAEAPAPAPAEPIAEAMPEPMVEEAAPAQPAAMEAAPPSAPQPVHPRPQPTQRSAPAVSRAAPPVAPQPVADPVERRVAMAPAPDEIRARAERVRQAALAARAEREAARAETPSFDDDAVGTAGLFDLDDLSIDAGSVTPEAPAHHTPRQGLGQGQGLTRRAAQPAPEAARPSKEEVIESAAATAARTGLFTINRLINRVAGHHDPQPSTPRNEPRYDPRATPPADRYDDDESDVPAFLRRQAN